MNPDERKAAMELYETITVERVENGFTIQRDYLDEDDDDAGMTFIAEDTPAVDRIVSALVRGQIPANDED